MYTRFQPAPEAEADETLLAKARADDREALETLLARHQPWVFDIALSHFSSAAS